LSDEAAEVIGRCATRRVIDLSLNDFLELLETSQLHNLQQKFRAWPCGGVVARYITKNGPSSRIFVACTLHLDCESRLSLQLLTERRLADSWARLLQANCGGIQ
jgi:hypothetical protein